ncbi:AraC family transcriptional regulator [Undibacterium sp. SXout11W]|uniref:AraC family transcriptional regulator n=1 Tax=Undibacterium sp. SXout11W TaxID=3413050 RepID=UPI003BF347D6
MNVEIIDFPDTLVAAIEHRGSPDREHESVRRLIAWRIAYGYLPERHRTFGVHYDDPLTIAPDLYRADFCISVTQEVAPNSYGIVNKVIPGGRCAMVRHFGSRENIGAARYLCETWLPESGESLRTFPLFFHYVNVGAKVLESEMVTDVYLPIY